MEATEAPSVIPGAEPVCIVGVGGRLGSWKLERHMCNNDHRYSFIWNTLNEVNKGIRLWTKIFRTCRRYSTAALAKSKLESWPSSSISHPPPDYQDIYFCKKLFFIYFIFCTPWGGFACTCWDLFRISLPVRRAVDQFTIPSARLFLVAPSLFNQAKK